MSRQVNKPELPEKEQPNPKKKQGLPIVRKEPIPVNPSGPPPIFSAALKQRLTDEVVGEYLRVGGSRSSLSFPKGPVRFFESNDGPYAQWPMLGGSVIARRDDDPYVVARTLVDVRYLGFECLRGARDDQGTSTDEPYMIVSYVNGNGQTTKTYENEGVKKGVVRHSSDLFAQATVGPGALYCIVIEHDAGKRSEAKKEVEAAMAKIMAAAQQAASIADASSAANAANGGVGDYTAATTVIAGAIGGPIGSLLVGGIVSALDLEDDFVGQHGETVFPISATTGIPLPQEEDYGPPPYQGTFGKEQWTHKFHIDGQTAGSYDVYFRVEVNTSGTVLPKPGLPSPQTPGINPRADRDTAAI